MELDMDHESMLGGQTIEFIEAPGPSSCNLMVYIPSAKTVIVGALLPEQTANALGCANRESY